MRARWEDPRWFLCDWIGVQVGVVEMDKRGYAGNLYFAMSLVEGEPVPLNDREHDTLAAAKSAVERAVGAEVGE